MRESVVVDLPHQGEQAADFSRRKSGSGEPVEVMPRQIGNQPALVFAIGHDCDNEQFEVLRIHRKTSKAEAAKSQLIHEPPDRESLP